MGDDGTEQDDDTQPGARSSDKDRGRKFPAVPAETPDAEATFVHGRPAPAAPSERTDDATLVRGAESRDDHGGEQTLVRPPSADRKPTERVPAPPAARSTREAVRPAAAKPASNEAGVIGGRFEIVRLLGEGGMGKVYEVRDRQIEGRAVALKVLLSRFSENEQFRKLFFQEIRAAQKFVNEHVTQVRDTGKLEDSTLFLTMDLVQGESLRALLDREKTLRPRQALEIARQTLLGLQSGHEHGFIHRDIKPPNIMLAARIAKTDENPYGVGVRLLDFGIAGVAAEVGATSGAGTAMYMSPEQAKGERLDARSDLFAVGVVLYEMLNGARPFSGKTSAEVMDSVIETDVGSKIAEMQEIPTPVRVLLDRALQKDRDKRFQSALEFAKAIEKSSAYQLPRVMPVWATVTLGACALAALFEGVLLATKTSDIDELRATIRNNDLARDSAVTNQQREDAKLLREQQTTYDNELRRKSAELSDALKQRDELQTWKTEKIRVEGLALNANAIEESKADQLKRELETIRQESARKEDSYEKRLAALTDEISAVKERNKKLETEQQPIVKTIRGFESVMGYIEDGLGITALLTLDDLARQGTFGKPGLEGTSFIRPAAACAAKLQTYHNGLSTPGGGEPLLLREARDLCTEAERGLTTFARDAQAWVTFQVDPSQQPPAHEERAGRVLDQLRRECDQQWKSVEQSSSPVFDDVAQHILERDPTQAFRVAKLFGSERLTPLCAAFTREARAKAVKSDQRLDPKGLAQLQHLGAWAQGLEQSDATLDPDDARDLHYLACAQRWYDSNDTNDDFELDASGLRPVTEAIGDWRWQLFLQWKLWRSISGNRLEIPRLQVQRRQAGERVSWRYDELGNTTPSSWTLHRRELVNNTWNAGADGIVTYECRNKSVVQGNSVLFDAHLLGDGVSVARKRDVWSGAMAPQLRIDENALARYRERWSNDSAPCLVFTDVSTASGVTTTTERWFAQNLGLVYEKSTSTDGSNSVRDLVFASPVE